MAAEVDRVLPGSTRDMPGQRLPLRAQRRERKLGLATARDEFLDQDRARVDEFTSVNVAGE